MALGGPLFWIGAIGFSHGPLGNMVTTAGAAMFGIGWVLLVGF